MTHTRTPAALAAACLWAAAAGAFAQTPPPPVPEARPPLEGPRAGPPRGQRPPAPRLADAGVETVTSGRVSRFLVNPNGEVDGLLLDDGTQVGFAPQAAARLGDAVKPKDAVQITGRRGEAGKVVRASMIKSTGTGRSVDLAPDLGPDRGPGNADAPPAPRAGRPDGALTAMNASGRVDALLYTERGDVNGALLKDGTVVRFPPHAAAGLTAQLAPGATLYARGYGTRSPQGSALEATAIGASPETAQELFAGPERPGRPPRSDDAPPPRPDDRRAPDAPPPRAP